MEDSGGQKDTLDASGTKGQKNHQEEGKFYHSVMDKPKQSKNEPKGEGKCLVCPDGGNRVRTVTPITCLMEVKGLGLTELRLFEHDDTKKRTRRKKGTN